MCRSRIFLACLLFALISPVIAAIQTVRQAEIVQGQVYPHETTSASMHWQTIMLDDAWRRQTPCRSGVWTYRARIDLQALPEIPYGLLIHKAGNRLHVWLNDTRIATFGDLDNPDTDYSNTPLYARFPDSALKTGRNDLLIQVGGDCRRFSGLSWFEVGPHQVLEPLWKEATSLTLWKNALIISICTTVSIVSFGIAFWHRNRQALLFAIITALWSVRCVLWGLNELPFSYELWFFLIDFTYGIWMLSVCLLAMDIAGVRVRWLRSVYWISLILFSITSVATALGASTAWKAFGLRVNILSCSAALFSVIHVAWRRPNSNNIAIGIAGASMLGLALIDHWNIWVSTAADAYHRTYLSPIAVMAFIASLGAVLIRRFDLALKSENRYRQSLEQEVCRQQTEIRQKYKEAEVFVRQEAIEQERQRIVREMHDGLGAQLVGILSTIHAPHAGTKSFEQDIQDALDQLHYIMDTMTTEGEDLTTILGQFRFRNESRIQQAGIRLYWNTSPLSSTHWPPQSLIHFDRILREIFTNILKHSGASEVTVESGCTGGQCHIHITDNGCGFDPESQAKGRGLRHLQERANELGIHLDLCSTPGTGTKIHLHWVIPETSAST